MKKCFIQREIKSVWYGTYVRSYIQWWDFYFLEKWRLELFVVSFQNQSYYGILFCSGTGYLRTH